MRKETIIIIVILIFLFLSPVHAAYQYVQLPNGKFEVTFKYNNPDAERVFIACGFNNYSPTATPMQRNEDGEWEYTIILEKGIYQYKYVVDGEWTADPDVEERTENMGNSVLRLVSNKIKGQFELSGELINRIIKEDKEDSLAFENEITLDLIGSVKRDNQKNMLSYNVGIKAEAGTDNIENISTEMDLLSVNKILLEDLNVTYYSNLFNVAFEANQDDKTDSFDYLGLLDANTESDDREFTENLNSFGDSRRLKLSGETEGYAYNAAITEYTNDITDDTSLKKYLGYFNTKKEFVDKKTQKTTGIIGVSALLYQPVVLDQIKERATSAAIFGEYQVANNLTLKGEYATIPLGSINESLSGTDRVADDQWRFMFDPRDYDLEADEINIVRIAGAFNGWNSADPDYQLSKEQTEGGEYIWVETFNLPQGTQYSWIVDGEWVPGGIGNLLTVGPRKDESLEQGSMYMAEVNYKKLDARRSFRERKKVYKLDYTLGMQTVDENAYLKVASDDLLFDEDANDAYFAGTRKYYGRGYYYPGISGLKLDLDLLYQPHYSEDDVIIHQMFKPGFEWEKPFPGLDYLKGYLMYSQGRNWSWDKIVHDDKNSDLISEVFLETKSKNIGSFKHIKLTADYRQDINIGLLSAETELLIPVDEIEYLKGSLDYVIGSTGDDIAQKPRVFVEGKIHNLPGIKDYLPYLIIGYEYDEGNLFEKKEFFDPDDDDDDENDWTQKVYSKLGLSIPDLTGFNASAGLEFMKIEDNFFTIPENPDEDSQYYLAKDRRFVEWYSLATANFAYDFPYQIRGELSLIYDLSHSEISEYEDYSLKLDLSKVITDCSTLKLSYNKKEGENRDIAMIMLETLF